MEKINLQELIYIAGFLDGDGSICVQFVKQNCKDISNEYRIRFTVQFTQKTKRRIYLDKLHNVIKSGYIRDRKKSGVSDYVITEPRHVVRLLKELQPYLRIKKKQANLVIYMIEQLPAAKTCKQTFAKIAVIVDQISALNDSKTTRKITSSVVLEKLLK